MKKAGKWNHEEQSISSHQFYTQVKYVTENVGISQWAGVILGSVYFLFCNVKIMESVFKNQTNEN